MSGLLGGFEQWAQHVVEESGYSGLALLVALENIFPPIPSEVILPLAGFLSAQGELWLPVTILAATVGSVAGALLLYGIGAWLGEERLRGVIRRYGHWLALGDEDLSRANGWFEHHGTRAVLIGRVIPVVRSLISIPAGVNHMPLPSFILYTALGSGFWNSVLIGAGWWLGDSWEQVSQYAQYLQYVLLAALIGGIGWFVYGRRHRQHDGAPSEESPR
jgi:membrane protein DedA with SNARE-associated domain